MLILRVLIFKTEFMFFVSGKFLTHLAVDEISDINVLYIFLILINIQACFSLAFSLYVFFCSASIFQICQSDADAALLQQ